ncbi:methylamine utilization protein MauJ [Mesorhizobium sp. B2-4-6]|uniref:methylamine utilization protein MauJ n=1 Tax=Mesorhizobium sp. B2-4-6 TaxID=2589943 RepID=UPI001127F5E6|nr:methylamine utilization protein MauJ [Mesorhizobium sp. B2-4-6]TPL49776.1 hypothetical protein FJ957_11975 [Mesorhizobium sp. B2-4-6]
MYARHLSDLLHRQLAEPREFEDTIKRFEAMRGYGLLPRGRQNAGVRLSNQQIASAVLGFVPTQPSWAGHVSLVLGSLCAVGGPPASIQGTTTLLDSIAAVLASDEACNAVVAFSFITAHKQSGDEYYAKAIIEESTKRRTVSYVSHMAVASLREGAELAYDHDRIASPSARQLVLGRDFFSKLRKDVTISRHLDLPLKADWREYETEEEKDKFHRRLGAKANSRFLNLGVDTQVTWPKEPTRVQFAGYNFVMFPRTKETSHSISIDLNNEHLSSEDARTLISRFLSLLSWCDDSHAVLKDGWLGNPVPVPVPRSESAFSTTLHWLFNRSIPKDSELLQRLAYYREGLNAQQAGLVTFEVLSFFKVFERRVRSKPGEPNPTKAWIRDVFDKVSISLDKKILERFNADRDGKEVEKYVFDNCRVAIAHTSDSFPSDADASPEIRRLYSAAEVIRELARYFINTEYGLSKFHSHED